MPFRPRKQILRRDEAGLSGSEMEHLITGGNLLDHEADPFQSEEARRATWTKHRDYIMGLMGQKSKGEIFGIPEGTVYFGYGTRPESWWKYDSPEPRRLSCGDPSGALPGRGLSKGVPRFYRSHEACKGMRYESEEEFLRRHKLLTEEEEATLSQADSVIKKH